MLEGAKLNLFLLERRDEHLCKVGLNLSQGDVLPTAARGEERFISCRRPEKICDAGNVVVVTTWSTDLYTMNGILADDTVVPSWAASSDTCQREMQT